MFESLKITGDKLYEEYKKYGRLIVAVDFDGTINQYNESEKQEELDQVIELVKLVQEYSAIVIYTVSNIERYLDIMTKCEECGIRVDGINNISEIQFPTIPKGNGNAKLYYNVLIDNRAGLEETYNALADFYVKAVRNK